MCPLYPLHIVLTYGFLLLCAWMLFGSTIAAALDTTTLPLQVRLSINESTLSILDLNEDESKEVTLYVDDLPPEAAGTILTIQQNSDDGHSHVKLSPEKIALKYDPVNRTASEEKINVSGTFLGFTKLKFVLSSGHDDKELMESSPVLVKVHRETTKLDVIFIHVVIILVLIAFVNMGCAINTEVIKENIRRPVAPAIGLASQYLFMPLFAYGVGYACFSSSPELWLGLFLTGCAPGGGGSNMWTYLLGGSLDLSITMTFLSTVVAFAALPLWVYALGPTIYSEGYFGRLPYRNIASLVFGLVIPCAIGLAIRRCSPKFADFLKKMLKPLSLVFIIFIMTFGVYAKFYLFYFFSWKVIIAGFCLPFFGFLFGAIVSIMLKRKWEDVIAISIETGVQNTGLAIGVIKVALEEFNPLGDIAIVLPVAVATMTPLPLFAALIMKRFREKKNLKAEYISTSDSTSVFVSKGDSNVDSNDNSKHFAP